MSLLQDRGCDRRKGGGSCQLALLGADVIKIEPRKGEEMRQTQAEALWAERKLSPSWLSVNGNKRSLTLDLRKPEATAIVKRLAAGVDAVWENFRPGVMDRLGIGYKTLAAVNPALIYWGSIKIRGVSAAEQGEKLAG